MFSEDILKEIKESEVRAKEDVIPLFNKIVDRFDDERIKELKNLPSPSKSNIEAVFRRMCNIWNNVAKELNKKGKEANLGEVLMGNIMILEKFNYKAMLLENEQIKEILKKYDIKL